MRGFNETQRFDQWPITLINIFSMAFVLYCLYKWFVVNESTGNISAENTLAQIFLITTIVGVLLLFFFLRLETGIDETGVNYRFFPFHTSKRNIPWSDIEKCYTRKYNPIGEFGGWGVRVGFGRNKAYNVKGNRGIQLVLKTGKKILLGTQKEDEAIQVIQRYFKKSHERI